jgi:hypothetical protein
MAKCPRFPDAMREIRSLASVTSPDARLIEACERYLLLSDEGEMLYRTERQGHMDRVREICAEGDALVAEITSTKPSTGAGRHAKASAAFCRLLPGTYCDLARSVLQDIMDDASDREG